MWVGSDNDEWGGDSSHDEERGADDSDVEFGGRPYGGIVARFAHVAFLGGAVDVHDAEDGRPKEDEERREIL